MNNSGQKMWGLLLVVDSFFVVIFGGALAAAVYASWQRPMFTGALSQSHSVHAPVKKAPPITPKPVAVLPAPAPTPAKPQVKAPVQVPIPHHSLKSERETTRATNPKIFAPRGKGKAMRVVFTYKNKHAKKTLLVGAFILHKGKEPLVKAKHGTWKITLYLTPGTYRYYFLVNGKKVLDPQNQEHDRNASLFSIAKP